MLEVAATPRARLNALSLYGGIALIAAAVVHFGTYVGRSIGAGHPLFWLLHAAIFPLFIAFALKMGAWQSESRGAFGLRRRRLRWRALRPYFPRWVPLLVALLFVYTLGNFFSSVLRIAGKGSGAGMTDVHMIYIVRAFSGHWLLFYALPTLFFAFVPWSAKPPAELSDAAD
jgi:hypothetical protein